MPNPVDILSVQIDCLGSGSARYVVRCTGRQFQVSLLPLFDEGAAGRLYWVDINELPAAPDESIGMRLVVDQVELRCEGRAAAFVESMRVIARLASFASDAVPPPLPAGPSDRPAPGRSGAALLQVLDSVPR